MLLSLLTLACSSLPPAELTGSVGGESFDTIQTTFFGGPFVLLSPEEYSCDDAWWVDRYYDFEDPPVANGDVAIQIEFNDSEIRTGYFSVGGDAEVEIEVLIVKENILDTWRARDGIFEVTIAEDDEVHGIFDNVVFDDDGLLNGTFAASWCINVSE